ncbi:MAG: hypothetical protein ACFE9L_12550 [Candidatus Hodarchaeota archaeon]
MLVEMERKEFLAKCPFTKHYCEFLKVIEVREDRTWIDGCIANPQVDSIPKFCTRKNWDLINVPVKTEKDKKFRDLYKRLVEQKKLWLYTRKEVRTEFHAWLLENHLI